MLARRSHTRETRRGGLNGGRAASSPRRTATRARKEASAMTPALYALGRLCVRHRYVVLVVWLVVVVGLAAAARGTGQQTSDNLVLPGTDSQRATDILSSRFPDQANGTNPIALAVAAGKKLSDNPY